MTTGKPVVSALLPTGMSVTPSSLAPTLLLLNVCLQRMPGPEVRGAWKLFVLPSWMAEKMRKHTEHTPTENEHRAVEALHRPETRSPGYSWQPSSKALVPIWLRPLLGLLLDGSQRH